jgi:hypothetical protein
MSRNKSVDLDALIERIKKSGAKTKLTRGEAAALIAHRTMDKHDNPRGAKNRIAMSLMRASARESEVALGGIETLADGRYAVDEIARWAKKQFGDLFSDLPTESRVFAVRICEGIGMKSGTSEARLPGSLDESHELILSLLALLKKH